MSPESKPEPMTHRPVGAPEPDAAPPVHHAPSGFSDRFALIVTRLLRLCADAFFAKRYGHRAIVLETVAAVPGIDEACFQAIAQAAKRDCPLSKALASAPEIALLATLQANIPRGAA